LILYKTRREIRLIREAGRILAACLEYLGERVKPGVTTAELDRLAEEFIRREGGIPTFKGYRPKHIGRVYRHSTCISVNDEVVHGLPGARVLEEGDLVSIDLGVTYRGYVGDGAATFPVGRVSPQAEKLIRVTREALYRGIERAVPGNRVGDISYAIQSFVEEHGFSVVREFVGHGVGRYPHEDPQVPNYGLPGEGELLAPGLVVAIEPMVNAGRPEIRVDDDGWTVRTLDGSLSAHFEHTVAITEEGPEILTR